MALSLVSPLFYHPYFPTSRLKDQLLVSYLFIMLQLYILYSEEYIAGGYLLLFIYMLCC